MGNNEMREKGEFFSKYKLQLILVGVIVVQMGALLFVYRECFFGEKVPPSKILAYIGAFLGGIIVFANFIAVYRRNKLTERTLNQARLHQNETNDLTEKGQLDIRFKDAAMLLANENTSAILSGIHALAQIAIEASRRGDESYAKTIKPILCAALCEHNKGR